MKRRPDLTAEVCRQIVTAYERGDKTVALQAKYRISPGEMYRILQRANINLRTHGGRLTDQGGLLHPADVEQQPVPAEIVVSHTDIVIRALKKVPEKRLLLIDLANSIPRVHGDFDVRAVTDRLPEINRATAEAKSYGAHTMMAVQALTQVKAIGAV